MAPGTWAPPGSQPPVIRTRPDPERPGRHIASVIVIAVLLVSMLGFSLVFGRLAPDAYGTAAERMLPADASRARFTAGGAGQPTSGEWARGRFGLLHSGPDPFGLWLNTANLDVREATYARWTTARPGAGPAGSSDSLFTVAADGLRLQATYSNGSGVIYSGGRLELPATLSAGATWQSSGVAIPWTTAGAGDSQPYTSEGKAVAAADPGEAARGCLDVTVTQAPGDVVAARTWCPGEGIVRFSERGQTWAVDAAAPAAAASPAVSPFTWDKAPGMTLSTIPLGSSSSLLALTLVAPVGILPDGRLVTFNAYSGYVIALDPASTLTGDLSLWRARPGGQLMTGATIGEVSVVVTSQRELVAYGPDGTWLWTRPLTDTTLHPPVELGGSIVVVTGDGAVTGVDPATGAVRWRHRLPTEVQAAAVRAGDGLLVHDEAGTLVHLGPGGEVRWQHTGMLMELMAVAGDTVLVTERGANTMRGYSMADGELVWKRSLHENLIELRSAGSVAVAIATGSVVAYDAAGRDAWTIPGETYAVQGGPDRALLVTGRDILLVDGSGQELQRWAHGIPKVADSQLGVATSGNRFAVHTWWHLALGVSP